MLLALHLIEGLDRCGHGSGKVRPLRLRTLAQVELFATMLRNARSYLRRHKRRALLLLEELEDELVDQRRRLRAREARAHPKPCKV